MENSTRFTIRDFNVAYSDNDACLKKLFELRFGDMKCCPKCSKEDTKFYKVKTRPVYECGNCGYQINPMANTIFHKSSTPLLSWFYAIFLFATSKNGVSAMEIQRQIGVTYKCAWRIGHKVRELMSEGDIVFDGIVEVDESLYGGKRKGKRGWGADNKTCLFGMIERGGRVKISKIHSRSKEIILPIMGASIIAGATVFTDEYRGYNTLPEMGFNHKTINHSKFQWKKGECHTNSIEGFWSNLKKSLAGTHTQVSAKWLQNYLDEFNFRHNHRKDCVMFDEILVRLA